MSLESSSSNMTFWFGHYPTSLIITEDGSDIRQLMRYYFSHLITVACPDFFNIFLHAKFRFLQWTSIDLGGT